MKPIHIVLLLFAIDLCVLQTDAQWVRQNSGTTANLKDVAVLDSLTAVVVGENGTILRTTDGGATWVQIDTIGGIRWNAVAFRNAKNGILAGDGLAGARTTDGGVTWSYWYFSGIINLVGVAYAGSTAFMVDDSGWVSRSTDDGTTWGVTRLLDNGPLCSIFFAHAAWDYYTGYALSPWSAFKTTDSGQSWTEEPNPFTRSDIPSSGRFSNNNDEVFIVGGRGVPSNCQPLILQKAWSDTTWQLCAPPTPLSMPCILHDIVAPGGFVYACGSSGVIATTSDIAATWRFTPYVAGFSGSLNAIDFFDELHGFAVGDSGTILATINGGVSGISDRVHRPGGLFQLEQNYPNPFNPSTTIRYGLPYRSHITLTVYNTLGQKVADLVNGGIDAGYHEVRFDGTHLASGVYYYRIQAGSFVETKKLLLMR